MRDIDDLLVAVPAGGPIWTARITGVAPDRRIDRVTVETASGLIVEAHRAVGWRFTEDGRVLGQDLTIQDLAHHAAVAALAGAASAVQLEEAARLAALVLDPTVWACRAVEIDGRQYPMFVLEADDGAAAVADLGAVRLVIVGGPLLDDLSLRLLRLDRVPLTAQTPAERTDWFQSVELEDLHGWVEVPDTGFHAAVAWMVPLGALGRTQQDDSARVVTVVEEGPAGELDRFTESFTEEDRRTLDQSVDDYLMVIGVPIRPSGFRWFIRESAAHGAATVDRLVESVLGTGDGGDPATILEDLVRVVDEVYERR